MAARRLRAGIVGAGFAAEFHAQMLRRVYSTPVDPALVFAPTPESREAFARKHGMQAVDSLDALIDGSDVIHVCAPAVAHEASTLRALSAGRHVIVEKPFTGYFGDGTAEFSGKTIDYEAALAGAAASIRRIREAEAAAQGTVAYAENWVYAPAVQKEREIIEKTGAQLLWVSGGESHSGSHSPYYGLWRHSGGGSLISKGVHPLTAALYLKKVEGRASSGRPIRPVAVHGRVHRITGLGGFRDSGYLRTDYEDVEDWAGVHLEFEDGTIADIFASELVLGGVHNWLEVNANNHRARININPNNALQTYNPDHSQFEDIYVVEKTGTKAGWAFTSPDEDWFTGYQHEMEAFYRAFVEGSPPESDSMLGADTIATVYAAYLSASRGGARVEVPRL